MSLPKITDHINFNDYVMIVQDKCIRMITYEEFIKEIVLGGFSICQAVLNCWESMGDFEDPPVVDHPPTFEDLYISLANRTQNFVITSDLFLQNYHDQDGDEFAKIIITGGDLSGVTLNDVPIHVGQVVTADDMVNFKFSAKDIDGGYQQTIDIEVYDENNVKAE
ncbi:hypothetical protein ACMGDK_11365 [Chryseobacterium sp. DT-3]|uniref:hypothetical protein n=1 Tax=Chryseobacterium sp. DT-3 TaxID=3396164 RepID=UPI003F1D1468